MQHANAPQLVSNGSEFKLKHIRSENDNLHESQHVNAIVADPYVDEMVHRSVANIAFRNKLAEPSKAPVYSKTLQLNDTEVLDGLGFVSILPVKEVWSLNSKLPPSSEKLHDCKKRGLSTIPIFAAPHEVGNSLIHLLENDIASEIKVNVEKYNINGTGFLGSNYVAVKFKIQIYSNHLYFSRKSADGMYFTEFVAQIQNKLNETFGITDKPPTFFNPGSGLDDDFFDDSDFDIEVPVGALDPIKEMANSSWLPEAEEAMTMLCCMSDRPKNFATVAELMDVYQKMLQSDHLPLLFPTAVILSRLAASNECCGELLKCGVFETITSRYGTYPHLIQKQAGFIINELSKSCCMEGQAVRDCRDVVAKLMQTCDQASMSRDLSCAFEELTLRQSATTMA